MNISSIKEKQTEARDIKTIVSDMLPSAIDTLTRLKGGANSQVYKIQCEGGEQYVAKLYFCHNNDKRDRMGVEYNGLSFLCEHGVKNIPRPIQLNRDESCAIYAFVDGKPIISEEVTESDVDQIIEFLRKLKGLRRKGRDTAIGPASEACFSAQAVVRNIESRLKRFDSLQIDSDQHNELSVFLQQEIWPALKTVTEWCKAQYTDKDHSFDEDITWDERILSSSDFGFHNALRKSDGSITFLDFEYFGWDDPAKTISDFLLHPAMDLSRNLTEHYLRKVRDLFPEHETLALRVRCLYPLYGLKWSVIFLNEFLNNEYSRRSHAIEGALDRKKRQKIQLHKSKALTRQIMQTYQEFPYSL